MDEDFPPPSSASKYNKPQIPAGIQDLLQEIGCQVLRHQPDDIVRFVSEMLNKLVGVRDGKAESKSDLSALKDGLPESLARRTL
uniref:RIIa domain-containing protein n=1 Tax=Ciona savignyi TaxID=51511 RepID=H2Z8S6_CIOSA